jgi:hypothetical protein
MPTAAVVSHLHFSEPPGSDLFARAQGELVPEARIVDLVHGLHVVQVAPDHFILVILGDDVEAIDSFATQVVSPWLMDHVVPMLASPPEQSLGPLVVTTERTVS